jgi:gamma-glutamyltranspeptidase/glutathione hydrolase
MDLQEAIEAPRVSLPYETDGIDSPSALTVNVEGRVDESACNGLASRGHIVEVKEEWTMFFGGMQGVQVHTSGGLSGGADPRRDGYAMGY